MGRTSYSILYADCFLTEDRVSLDEYLGVRRQPLNYLGQKMKIGYWSVIGKIIRL